MRHETKTSLILAMSFGLISNSALCASYEPGGAQTANDPSANVSSTSNDTSFVADKSVSSSSNKVPLCSDVGFNVKCRINAEDVGKTFQEKYASGVNGSKEGIYFTHAKNSLYSGCTDSSQVLCPNYKLWLNTGSGKREFVRVISFENYKDIKSAKILVKLPNDPADVVRKVKITDLSTVDSTMNVADEILSKQDQMNRDKVTADLSIYPDANGHPFLFKNGREAVAFEKSQLTSSGREQEIIAAGDKICGLKGFDSTDGIPQVKYVSFGETVNVWNLVDSSVSPEKCVHGKCALYFSKLNCKTRSKNGENVLDDMTVNKVSVQTVQDGAAVSP